MVIRVIRPRPLLSLKWDKNCASSGIFYLLMMMMMMMKPRQSSSLLALKVNVKVNVKVKVTRHQSLITSKFTTAHISTKRYINL